MLLPILGDVITPPQALADAINMQDAINGHAQTHRTVEVIHLEHCTRHSLHEHTAAKQDTFDFGFNDIGKFRVTMSSDPCDYATSGEK